jgi:glycosyltransferase involved in cell wall biosynthesis
MLFKKYNFLFINGNIRHGIRLFKSSHFFRSFILWLSPYVVANSAAGLTANNLKANDRNFVLYNGINIPELKFLTREEKRKLRKKIFPGRNTGNLFFISVANFMPVKDYYTVIKALSELKKNISFEYLIIGDGPLRNQIIAEIEKSGLKENTHLIGRVSDIKKYLEISDIYIHSSKGEGISNTILEAMMAGLPVVSSDVGGVRETVYEKTSFLFRYQDMDGLKNCIIKALNIPDKNFFNDENYIKHLEKFSAETMVKNFCGILNKITGEDL